MRNWITRGEKLSTETTLTENVFRNKKNFYTEDTGLYHQICYENTYKYMYVYYCVERKLLKSTIHKVIQPVLVEVHLFGKVMVLR